MIWRLQPDGRYWGDDDGFGMEGGPQIKRDTFPDEKENFDGPSGSTVWA